MSRTMQEKARVDLEQIIGAGTSSASSWTQRRDVKWAAVAVLGLLLVGLASSFSSKSGAVRYLTEPASRGSLVVVVTATGSVQPINKVDVSSELSGTVRKVLVDYNSPVVLGQTLAELDADKLKATADSSRAKVAAALAKVADANVTIVEKQRELARKKSLSAKQYSSTHDLDVAQAAYDRAVAAAGSARADMGVAEAELKLSETNLAKAIIASPINGVVLKRNVDPGQTVASSFQAPVLFSIAENLKQMELQVDVDEADVGKVRAGQNASFGVDAFPDRKFPASIRDVRFASETIQGVVTYKAVLSVDNSELLLRPGMTATAEIRVTELTNSLLVPNAALRYRPSVGSTTDNRSFLRRLLPGPPQFRPASPNEETGPHRTVWKLQNGVPVPVKVTIGMSDGKRTQILGEDVPTGEALIIDQAAAKL